MYQLQKDKNINTIFYVSMSVGLVFSILHLTQFLFDMIVSVAFYSKANVSSIVYILCHFLVVFVPLLMIIPNGKVPKALILKWVFYGIAACYFLGNVWIIYFIYDNSFSALFSTTAENFRYYQSTAALSFNYMTWECYTPLNMLFSLLQALMFLVLGTSLENGRAVFSLTLPISTAITIIVPLIFIILEPYTISNLEITMNRHAYILASQLFTSIGLYAISVSSHQWEKFLWTYSPRRD